MTVDGLQLIHVHYTPHTGPGTPTGVTVQAQSCHTVKVTWSPPDQTGGLPITGYNVTYTDLTTTVMSSVTEQMILIQHLSLGTAYKVVVRATNVVGQGQEVMKSDSTDPRGTAQLQTRQ